MPSEAAMRPILAPPPGGGVRPFRRLTPPRREHRGSLPTVDREEGLIMTREELVRRYVAVWSEPDPAARRAAVAALWVEGGTEFVAGARYRGPAELAERVGHAYDTFVGSGAYTVTSAGDLAVHGDIVTFTVQLAAGDEVAWAARVFLLLDGDRIREDYQLTVKPLPAR